MSYIYNRKTLYYETDQMAVMHHTNYLRWFEEARTEFLEARGLPLYEIEKQNILIPVIDAYSKYIKSVKFGDVCTVHLKIELYTGSRVNLSYEIYNQNNELCNTGSTKHCFINSSGKVLNLRKVLPELDEIFVKEVPAKTKACSSK